MEMLTGGPYTGRHVVERTNRFTGSPEEYCQMKEDLWQVEITKDIAALVLRDLAIRCKELKNITIHLGY